VSDAPLELSERDGAIRLALAVKPRSSRSGLLCVKGGALVVALRSPPVDGAANEELIAVLAKSFGVRRAEVVIATGATGRRKLVELRGVSVEAVRARVAALG